jgi:oligoribonuclease NrnB/cAMP/cGMP phosphodiesterase (DHH superfamily)
MDKSKEIESNFSQAKDAYENHILKLKSYIKTADITEEFREEFVKTIEKMEFAVQTNNNEMLLLLENKLKNIVKRFGQ